MKKNTFHFPLNKDNQTDYSVMRTSHRVSNCADSLICCLKMFEGGQHDLCLMMQTTLKLLLFAFNKKFISKDIMKGGDVNNDGPYFSCTKTKTCTNLNKEILTGKLFKLWVVWTGVGGQVLEEMLIPE